MQNFTECARRHCTVSKKFIRPALRYYTGKHSDSSKTSRSSSYKIWTNRLFNPVPPIISRDFQVISSFFLRNNCVSSYNIFDTPGLYSVRYFHATPASGCSKQPKKDNEKKTQQKENENEWNKEDPDKKKPPSDGVPFIIHMFIMSIVGSFAYVLLAFLWTKDSMEMNVPWNDFEHQMLAKGEVKRIVLYTDRNIALIELHDDAIVNNKRSLFRNLAMVVPDMEKIEEKIREAEDRLHIPYSNRVPILYVPKQQESLIGAMLLAAAIGLLIYSAASPKGRQFITQLEKMRPGAAHFTLIEPTTGKGIKFSDVAGLSEAKVEVMEFVDYLKSPERYKELGAKIPKGALLLGPPGCGKTMLAKAVATESNVPFMSMNGCEFVEMYGGLGAARVRDLFKAAKKHAPSIIYIDEIDAFGTARSTNAHVGESEGERTLVQLLVEMDGMTTRDDIIVLASTNRSEVLDKALLRPGRLDRHILIDLPTPIERQQIFETHLASLKLQQPASEYSNYLSSLTQGFTGADIANVCNEAALHAARLGKKKVYGNDLMYAIERSHRGTSKATNAMSPQEKRVVAYRESGFALLSWILEHTTAVAKISIVPTTAGSFSNTQLLLGSIHTLSLNKIEDLTCAYLGGRVAENIVFGYMTSVTMDQLKKATSLVYKQVAQYGMSPAVGLLNFEPSQYKEGGRKPFSKKLDSVMDAEVRRIIAQAGDRAEELLVKNRKLLNALAEELLKRETLYYDDIERLIGAPPYPKQRPQIPPAFMNDEEIEKSKT